MADDDEEDYGEPFKTGARIHTPDGAYATVFWCYPEQEGWRVYFMYDDGTNDNALHTEIQLAPDAPPAPVLSDEEDVPDEEEACRRCLVRYWEREVPDLYCEVCWKEWFYGSWPN